MLGLMISNGPDAFFCGEVGNWLKVSRHKPDHDTPRGFAPFQDLPASRFHEDAFDHFNTNYLVDSTGGIDWIIDVNKWLSKTDINVYNILIYKNPVRHTFSYWKRGIADTLSARYYKWPYRHRRIIRSGIDYVTVNYKNLVDSPARTLRQICGYTGVSYFSRKENFWESESNFIASSPGVRQQVDRGSSGFALEPYPQQFEPVANQVRKQVDQDSRIQYVLHTFMARHLSHQPEHSPSAPHQYTPSMAGRIEHSLWKSLKGPLFRLRWNVIDPIFGDAADKLTKRLFYTHPERENDPAAQSYDPDADRDRSHKA